MDYLNITESEWLNSTRWSHKSNFIVCSYYELENLGE